MECDKMIWPLGCHVCCVLSLSQTCPDPHQNKGWGWRRETGLSPYWPFQGGTSFVDLLWFFLSCVVCLCAHLFIDALWSPAGKGLTSGLSFVVSNCECVILGQVCYLIVSIPDLCILIYFDKSPLIPCYGQLIKFGYYGSMVTFRISHRLQLATFSSVPLIVGTTK